MVVEQNELLPAMMVELDVACGFFTRLLKNTGLVEKEKIKRFTEILRSTFENCYIDCWFPEKPFRGSGNRCIRVHPFKMDPLLAEVAELACIEDVGDLLPREFTFWIDPNCVCYRFGERTPTFELYDGVTIRSPVLHTQESVISFTSFPVLSTRQSVTV